MYRMNSALKTRLHGFVLTHDGGRLFSALMGGLVLAWMFVALITTGAFCVNGQTTAEIEGQMRSTPVNCQSLDEVAPGSLVRCVIDPAQIRTHDI